MIPHPDLFAATASPPRMAAARQRGMDVFARWCDRADVQALSSVLARISEEPVSSAADLHEQCASWLDDMDWLAALLGEVSTAMRVDPFTAFPFRPLHGRVVDSIALLQTVQADVTLCWVDALTLPHAQDPSAVFSDTLSVIKVVRSGGLTVRSNYLSGPVSSQTVVRGPLRELVDGELLSLDNRTESLTMCAARADAVLLRISVRLPKPERHRRYAAETGQLVGTSLGDDSVSRMLPLLSIARLAGRAARASAVLADCARHTDPVLRWAAVREWLVADTAQALAALPAMAADDPDPDVRRAAAATLAIFAVPEPMPCLA